MNGFHSCQRSGYTNRCRPFGTHLGNYITQGIQIHVFMGCKRSFFSVIQTTCLSIGQSKNHKSTSTNISCERIGDGQREFSSDHGIKGVSSFFHNTDSNGGRFFSGGHDHSLFTDQPCRFRRNNFRPASRKKD